jgi:hypothetical protein
VASGSPRLLLASDVAVPPPLAPIRGLLQAVGDELVGLCRGGLAGVDGGRDVAHLAEVLGLLAGQGWRPSRGLRTGLSGLWERLAAHAEGAGERRRLLIAALEAAEGFDEVRRVRDQLTGLEADSSPPQTGERGT